MKPPASCSPTRTISFGSSWRSPGVSTSSASGTLLEAQWPERMERALEETVAGLAARLEGEYQDALEARVQRSGAIRKDLSSRSDPEVESDRPPSAQF